MPNIQFDFFSCVADNVLWLKQPQFAQKLLTFFYFLYTLNEVITVMHCYSTIARKCLIDDATGLNHTERGEVMMIGSESESMIS